MNGNKPATTEQCNKSNQKPFGDRKKDASISSFCHHPAYLSRNPTGYLPSYNPVYYPGSYTHLSQPSTALYNQHQTALNSCYDKVGYPVPTNKTANNPHPSYSQDWNRFNVPSPLTTCTTKIKSTSVPHGKSIGTTVRAGKNPASFLPKTSQKSASNVYIDPKILDAAHALKLPPGGQKYSVEHWKGALVLCYRWKTTTNEEERQFYRKSTTTNSLSSATLKSIKFFCESILQRKTKRRQFAIHWKESGLKNIADESASSNANLFEHDDPKIEKILDDYFSGRTRSDGYNEAKERILEDRQKEIIGLWDELMSGAVLGSVPSYKKLYLLQLAIEMPHQSKIETETKNKKVLHDVVVEGFGGKSYWEKNDPSPTCTSDETQKVSVEGLPFNKNMNKRFWKCIESLNPKREEKKRRLENDEKSITSQLPQSGDVLSNQRLNAEDNPRFEEDKENDETVEV